MQTITPVEKPEALIGEINIAGAELPIYGGPATTHRQVEEMSRGAVLNLYGRAFKVKNPMVSLEAARKALGYYVMREWHKLSGVPVPDSFAKRFRAAAKIAKESVTDPESRQGRSGEDGNTQRAYIRDALRMRIPEAEIVKAVDSKFAKRYVVYERNKMITAGELEGYVLPSGAKTVADVPWKADCPKCKRSVTGLHEETPCRKCKTLVPRPEEG